ncbi:hypothetical protein BKA62DRAFT_722254 [Auriculariales sp. MPI-PUGE-AT-0066]|nr:hypothetical protein BKA62DRAFT_722254 [Auriculariales sp. MPI-PUGE-AT-0066]
MLNPDQSAVLLDSLSAVLQIPSSTSTVPDHIVVKAFHKSFSDFLVDPKRCTDERFRILRNREEPRLALAMVQAADTALAKLREETVLGSHLRKYWCQHLLNTLRNPNLDSTRVLSAIQAWLQAGPIERLHHLGLTNEHLINIRFLLAVLVNKLPEPMFIEFQRDITALARIGPSTHHSDDVMAVHAITAIILHDRISQQLEAGSLPQSEPSDFVHEDLDFSQASDSRMVTLRRIQMGMSNRTVYLYGQRAQRCSSKVPDLWRFDIALIKLMEICMVARLQYSVEPVIPWLQTVPIDDFKGESLVCTDVLCIG